MRRVAAVLIVFMLAGAVIGAFGRPASAAGRTLSGTILSSDGRAVSALLGFDLKDTKGRTLSATGCVQSPACPVSGYGITSRINFNLGPDGSTDTGRWTTTWRVQVPAATARVFVEAYPAGARYTGTNESRYGHAYRRNLAVPYGAPVTVRLPLVCARGGATGHINGYATVAGKRTQLKRVTTWSLGADDNRPTTILGWNVGTTEASGFWKLANLPVGQTYQVLATAPNGQVKRYYDVPVSRCRGTHLAVAF